MYIESLPTSSVVIILGLSAESAESVFFRPQLCYDKCLFLTLFIVAQVCCYLVLCCVTWYSKVQWCGVEQRCVSQPRALQATLRSYMEFTCLSCACTIFHPQFKDVQVTAGYVICWETMIDSSVDVFAI